MAAADTSDLVSVRQDRRRPLSGHHLSRQSPDPVAGARGTRHLPARLDSQAAGGRIPDSRILSSGLAGLGEAAPPDPLPSFLSPVRPHLAPPAGLFAATMTAW